MGDQLLKELERILTDLNIGGKLQFGSGKLEFGTEVSKPRFGSATKAINDGIGYSGGRSPQVVARWKKSSNGC